VNKKVYLSEIECQLIKTTNRSIAEYCTNAKLIFYETLNKKEIEKLNDVCFYLIDEEVMRQNEFLTKRENKLQTIEQMYKSGSVDLDKLRKIVLEEE
jgi:hypothetical protein